MLELDVEALLLRHASHVHEARAIRTGDILSTSVNMALHLVKSHLCRDGSLLNREHTAKAATFIRTFRLNDVDAIDQQEQILNLVELRYMLLAG